jgi:hypothetical protein
MQTVGFQLVKRELIGLRGHNHPDVIAGRVGMFYLTPTGQAALGDVSPNQIAGEEAMTRTSQAPRMDAFTEAYFEAALWSSHDQSDEQGGEPLDKNYGIKDIDPATRDKMIDDCVDFQQRYRGSLDESGIDSAQAGHWFWLSRNNHGAGFFDDGHDALQKAAESYGEFDLYVGDDGRIHGSPLGAYGRPETRPGVRERGRHAGPGRVRTPRTSEGRWTVEAGRQLYFDGQPFIGVSREGNTQPAVADGATHLIAELLNSAGTTPDTIYRRHMGHARRRR